MPGREVAWRGKIEKVKAQQKQICTDDEYGSTRADPPPQRFHSQCHDARGADVGIRALAHPRESAATFPAFPFPSFVGLSLHRVLFYAGSGGGRSCGRDWEKARPADRAVRAADS